MKKIHLFIYSLFFFSFLIFLGNYFFAGFYTQNQINSNIEKHYIDPSVINNEYISISETSSMYEKEAIQVDLKSAYNINYIYFPDSFKSNIIDYTNSFNIFLNSKSISDKIDNLRIEFYKNKNDVRGKMKDHSIRLFGVEGMGLSECSAVGIHEFGHFIDLYFLKKNVLTDLSDYFYNISWESTKVMKAGLLQSDFVSGYAMTNKYEDFAESFIYFILHNQDFAEKAKVSEVLKIKYNFFIKYLFRDNEFVGTNFSTDKNISSYYRDITKIDFSLENFLEFIKK